MIASVLLAFALAVASISAAGVAPMGGAAHQQAMTGGQHQGMDGHEAPMDAGKCPSSIIACGGIGMMADADAAGLPAETESEPWRPEARAAAAHEPNLEAPPPKA